MMYVALAWLTFLAILTHRLWVLLDAGQVLG